MVKQNKQKLRCAVVSAIMGAIGAVLMFPPLEFSIPLMPSFIKFDFSELPALITSFTFGPIYGILVCLIKNLIHLLVTTTAGMGELSNFVLGAVFVGIAGVMYRKRKSRTNALLGCLLGAVIMAIISVITNYFIIYPFYSTFLGLPMDVIIGMYKAIYSEVDNLVECLIVFNLPFNVLKGVIDSLICFAVYKKLSPIIKGKL